MKSLLSFLFVLLINTSGIAQEAPASADAILQQAYQQATKESKKVFIIFHASWCGWCRKMDAALNDKDLKDFFGAHYVIKHITVLESDTKRCWKMLAAKRFMSNMAARARDFHTG